MVLKYANEFWNILTAKKEMSLHPLNLSFQTAEVDCQNGGKMHYSKRFHEHSDLV